MIDTHTHLYHHQFDEDRHLVLERARKEGVKRFYLPNIDASSLAALRALAASEDDCYAMSGLHPGSVKENWRDETAELMQAVADEPQFYHAIGEIGVDLYWDKTFKKEQQEAFALQIEAALSFNKPFVIHCRNAFDEVFEVVETFKGRGIWGIFHCFTGNEAQAQQALDLNLKLGIGGIVTFKNGGLQPVIETFALSDMVLETDAPFLAPTPWRGKRNESSYIKYVCEKIATIKNSTPQEVARVTSQAALQIFEGHG